MRLTVMRQQVYQEMPHERLAQNVSNLIQEQLKIIFSLMRYWCIFTPKYKTS